MAACMSLFSNGITEGLVFRFCIQLVVVLAIGLSTAKVWQHYNRNPYSFLHYLFLFFVALFMQSAVKLSVFSLRILGFPSVPGAVMPMLDHALKMGWAILFIYAFIVTISGMKFTKQYYLAGNLYLMVFLSSIVWLNWLQYLDTASPVQLTSGFFWGELLLEAWITLILVHGLFCAVRVHSVLKGTFLLAVTLMISLQLFHCWNIMDARKSLLWLFAMDRMLLLLFSAVTMNAAFSYSKIVNGDASDSGESLPRNSGPVRDGAS
jgi:hypothetical protein